LNTKNTLFSDFESVNSKQWKQQIQYELKGADYNETLVWESLEGIKVKPFYHNDEEVKSFQNSTSSRPFSIVQNIFVHEVKPSNHRVLDTLNRGAEIIRFTIENETIDLDELMQGLPQLNTK